MHHSLCEFNKLKTSYELFLFEDWEIFLKNPMFCSILRENHLYLKILKEQVKLSIYILLYKTLVLTCLSNLI